MLLIFLEKMLDAVFAFIPRPKPSLQQALAAQLIAHRGAYDNALGIKENTLAAFRLAAESGCWGIELDVHRTADQVFVVNHDPTLMRLWGHNVAIAELSFAALRSQVPEIPTLAEVVAEFGQHMHLFIELKIPLQDEKALVTVLHGLIPIQDYHLLSLDASYFYSLSSFPKQAFLLVAVHNNTQRFCDLSLKESYGGVLGHYLLITNKVIQRLLAAQQIVGVGFIDSEYSLYRELRRGIPWIFTNRVNKIKLCLKSLLNQ